MRAHVARNYLFFMLEESVWVYVLYKVIQSTRSQTLVLQTCIGENVVRIRHVFLRIDESVLEYVCKR